MSGGNGCERVTAIVRTGSLVMSLVSLLAACMYGCAEHLFGYTLFDTHEGRFIMLLSTLLTEEASNVELFKLTTVCDFAPVMTLLASKRNAAFDWGCYVAEELQFPGFDFETWVVSDSAATGAAKHPKVG